MTTRTQPLVSVIVPVYNVEAYLDVCLDSVRGQTYRNLEIILVEDCSTDDSLQVLDKHLADERVRLIRHGRNSGLSAARNTGIEAAQGAYLLFVDSDDLIKPDLVEVCVECALDNEADLVLFDFMPFQDGGEVQRRRPKAEASPTRLLRRDASFFALPQFAWLKFMRSELVREHGLRFPVGYYYEDGPFHWELGLHAKRVFHLGEPYYHYRQRGTSITGSKGAKLFDLFAIQLMISEALDGNEHVPGVADLLAEKVYSSIWYVSTSIGDEYVEEALVTIRSHLKTTRDLRSRTRPDAKVTLLLAILRLPRPFALAAIRLLRNSVGILSPSRRVVRRNASTHQPALA